MHSIRQLATWCLAAIALALAIAIAVPAAEPPQIWQQTIAREQSRSSVSLSGESEWPPLGVHPLPESLAKWKERADAGDYFDRVRPSPAGYLVWSQFPIRTYVERAPEGEDTAALRRARGWERAVLQAIAEWTEVLPLQLVERPEDADILVWRSRPPVETRIDPETGRLRPTRARTAQTRYRFYWRSRSPNSKILAHQMAIDISPGQSEAFTLATARHELGHALGIWGHSTQPTDALYFSQVRTPPPISPRDVNTLRRIYLQPTRLGWPLEP